MPARLAAFLWLTLQIAACVASAGIMVVITLAFIAAIRGA